MYSRKYAPNLIHHSLKNSKNIGSKNVSKISNSSELKAFIMADIPPELIKIMPWFIWYQKSLLYDDSVSTSNSLIKLLIDVNSPQQFSFKPPLSALGDFTPTVEWILAQLEMKAAVLPEVTYTRFVALMEALLNLSKHLSLSTDSSL